MASSRRTIKINPLDEVRASPESSRASEPASQTMRSARSRRVKKSNEDAVIQVDPSSAAKQVSSLAESTQVDRSSVATPADIPSAARHARRDAEKTRTLGLRAPDGGRAFVRYVQDSKVSDCEVLLNVKTRDVGFLDHKGEFVSLMHLSGPVTSGSSLKSFGPMALVASMMTGLVGCAAASLMKGRGQFVFRLGQFPNEGKYVSIDENALNILKALSGRWDVKSPHVVLAN